MITQNELRDLLDYYPDTGRFVWARTKQGIRGGSAAGKLNMYGYISIQINLKRYLAHRLAWLYIHGKMPLHEIDHINGVRHDNRLSNLREATRNQNMANMCSRRTGPKGASFNKGCWRARITSNGVHRVIGYFSTESEAHEAYKVAARQVHGEFAKA